MGYRFLNINSLKRTHFKGVRFFLFSNLGTFLFIGVCRAVEMYVTLPLMTVQGIPITPLFILSPIIAPFLSLCQLTPLFYFVFIVYGVRTMLEHLRETMRRSPIITF